MSEVLKDLSYSSLQLMIENLAHRKQEQLSKDKDTSKIESLIKEIENEQRRRENKLLEVA